MQSYAHMHVSICVHAFQMAENTYTDRSTVYASFTLFEKLCLWTYKVGLMESNNHCESLVHAPGRPFLRDGRALALRHWWLLSKYHSHVLHWTCICHSQANI